MTSSENKNLVSASGLARKRVFSKAVPSEGEGNLFSQSWFPICFSSDVQPGKVRGEDFLSGRVIVVRGADGVAQVLSAYCPHLGTDLSQGCVIENSVRCPFHHWKFDREGNCVEVHGGATPPRQATLFKYPTMEKYGIIWAFNGEEPLFQLPDLVFPDDELIFKQKPYPVLPVDPWMLCSNPSDLQHLRALHGLVLETDQLEEKVQWSTYSMRYAVQASVVSGDRIDVDATILGTNIFRQVGTMNGRWYCCVIAMGLPGPGKCKPFFVIGTNKPPESDLAATSTWMDSLMDFEMGLLDEDKPILDTAHFRIGVLSKADKVMARYFEYVRTYPRANPGAEFIT